MKAIYIISFFIAASINASSQKNSSGHSKAGKAKTSRSNFKKTSFDKSVVVDTVVKPRETVTEKYLKSSSSTKATVGTTTHKTTVFVKGIHAAPDAGEKFDTNKQNLNPNDINNLNNNTAAITPVAAPNDTLFNTNTITNNSVNTNSGAIDRSGNAQFGQSNWGDSRSTVGESEWTVPPPVTASFTKEFPTARNAIWSRNNPDSATYSARYKSGDLWITTNYSASGQRLDIKSEVPLASLPLRVRTYASKLPTNLRVSTITKWQVLGKADVYQIQTMAGKIFYVNGEGAEVNY